MLQPKRTKFRKAHKGRIHGLAKGGFSLSFGGFGLKALEPERDRKSTRLNSSHANISYAVFCLKKKKKLTSCPCLPAMAFRAFLSLGPLSIHSSLPRSVPPHTCRYSTIFCIQPALTSPMT